MTMKRQNILGAITALGLISGSMASASLIGTTAVQADDWSSSDDRPAWSQRCDRNWDNAYCNPKVDDSRAQGWIDSVQVRNQDPWIRNQDRWDNSRGQWQSRDPDQWQDQDRSRRARLSAGTYIPTYSDRYGRRIVLRRQERYPLTLVVSQDILGRPSHRGRVALPRNSRIEGELVPTRDGYRFEAERVRFPNGRYEQIWALSNVVRQNDRYDRYDRRDANVSSGAASILSSILGRTNSNSSVLGDVFDRYPNARRELVVIYPDQSLDLKLTRDFVVDWRNF
jgi:hypothetical protein